MISQTRKNNCFIKSVSSIVAAVFLIETVLWGAQGPRGAYASEVEPRDLRGLMNEATTGVASSAGTAALQDVRDLLQYSISEKIGSVKQSFRGGPDKLVIHIILRNSKSGRIHKQVGIAVRLEIQWQTTSVK